MLEDAARRWIGLTLGHCDHSEPFTLHHVMLEDPALVLWLSDAPEIHVSRGAGRWTLRPKEGLFDYYPCGLYELVHHQCGQIVKLVGVVNEDQQTLGVGASGQRADSIVAVHARRRAGGPAGRPAAGSH